MGEQLREAPADWRSHLQALLGSEAPNAASLRLSERLLGTMRLLTPFLASRVLAEIDTVTRVFQDPRNRLTQAQLDEAVTQRVLAGYEEVATDFILSHNGTRVQSYECLGPLVCDQLRREAQGHREAPVIDHAGALFLDVNGMKTIVDCTDHRRGCAFLQRLVALLKHLPPELQTWCDERGLSLQPHSVGGDEFLVWVQSQCPLTDDVLAALEDQVRTAVAADPALSRQFIDFDSTAFLLDYGSVPDDRRETILALATEQERREALTDVRQQLPTTFVPSVSIGSARLAVALEHAVVVAQDSEAEGQTATSFDDVAFNAFQHLVELADAASKRDKRQLKDRLRTTDPRMYAFLVRNAEQRELLLQLERQTTSTLEYLQLDARIDARLLTIIDSVRRSVQVLDEGQQAVREAHELDDAQAIAWRLLGEMRALKEGPTEMIELVTSKRQKRDALIANLTAA